MNQAEFLKNMGIDLSRNYTIEGLNEIFGDKPMYERVLKDKQWVTEPTEYEIALRLVIQNQNDKAAEGNSISSYFRLAK